MSAFVDYLLHDPLTGEIRQWGNCPEDMVEAQARDGLTVRLHNKGDDIANYRIGASGQLVRKGRNHGDVEIERMTVLARTDQHFAELQAAVAGPFAAVHAAKRAQAEAGGGPLIGDEAERLAVLERAAQQDADLAEIEARRMSAKRAIRAARNVVQIKAIVEGIE